MSALFSEYATQEGGSNYGKDTLSAYKATSDPETLYQHQDTKEENRKELLLAMIKEVTDKTNNGNLSLIRIEEIKKREHCYTKSMTNEEEEGNKDPPNQEVESHTKYGWLNNEENDTLRKSVSTSGRLVFR